MQCGSTITVPKKNNPKERVTVPCGKCVNCMSNKRSEWTFRLEREEKASRSAFFLTLTYDELKVPYIADPISGEVWQTLNKAHLSAFIKKIRNYITRDKKALKIEGKPPKIRFYAIGEYGPTTKRPHYHVLLFNLNILHTSQLKKLWEYGFIHIGAVNTASIHYVTKYFITYQNDYWQPRENPFTLMSQGIGKNYMVNKTMHQKLKRTTVKNNSGIETKLPRYYKERMFSKVEREAITAKQITEADKREIKQIEQLRKAGLSAPAYRKELAEKSFKKTNELIKKSKL